MQTQEKMYSFKNTGRTAGFLYFILAITAAYTIMYVPSQIIVRGNAAVSTGNMIANEFLFRTGIVSHLISETLFIYLVLVLYRLLKGINERRAKLMVALVLVQIPIVFLIESFSITSLMIAKGEILQSFSVEQRQDMAMLFLKIHGSSVAILEIFWGLWLIPLGQLIYKSGIIPRVLGILLIIGGLAYIIESLTFLLFPAADLIILQYLFIAYSLAEVSTIFWLLIKGAKEQRPVNDIG